MKSSIVSKRFWQILAAILIAEAAGIMGSVFTSSSVTTWYATINRPSFNPPGWVFGPVWTTLYVLMGVASFLVWEKRGKNKWAKPALMVYAVQLVLNTLWSILFFGLQNPGLAFIEIILLWSSILACMILFHRVSHTAAWLLLPYILWVSFASFLNFTLWRLNPGLPSASQPVACTMEAKLCPDGSYVGRTGPNCEFTPCP